MDVLDALTGLSRKLSRVDKKSLTEADIRTKFITPAWLGRDALPRIHRSQLPTAAAAYSGPAS